jgi:hypothetical protein
MGYIWDIYGLWMNCIWITGTKRLGFDIKKKPAEEVSAGFMLSIEVS